MCGLLGVGVACSVGRSSFPLLLVGSASPPLPPLPFLLSLRSAFLFVFCLVFVWFFPCFCVSLLWVGVVLGGLVSPSLFLVAASFFLLVVLSVVSCAGFPSPALSCLRVAVLGGCPPVVCVRVARAAAAAGCSLAPCSCVGRGFAVVGPRSVAAASFLVSVLRACGVVASVVAWCPSVGGGCSLSFR